MDRSSFRIAAAIIRLPVCDLTHMVSQGTLVFLPLAVGFLEIAPISPPASVSALPGRQLGKLAVGKGGNQPAPAGRLDMRITVAVIHRRGFPEKLGEFGFAAVEMYSGLYEAPVGNRMTLGV
jgi:hypothetical protein